MSNPAASLLLDSERDRHIALIGAAPGSEKAVSQAMDLFGFLLWAIKGNTQPAWKITDPDDADVIVIPQGQMDERRTDWNTRKKLIIEIVAPQADQPPSQKKSSSSMTAITLEYPFQSREVVDLLKRLDAQLSPAESEHSGAAHFDLNRHSVAVADQHAWDFVDAVRTLRQLNNPRKWLIGRNGKDALLWLSGDEATYFTQRLLAEPIRAGRFNLNSLELELADGPTPVGMWSHPAVELTWFAGYRASDQLAPWLNQAARYRITRWPDFGVIRPSASQIRISALLHASSITLYEVVTRAKVSNEEAIRTLNALSACNVVELELVATAAHRSNAMGSKALAAKPQGGFNALFQRMRKHLGMSA
jgi:hypothetical protein